MAPCVFISHDSALQFWRAHDLEPSGGIKRTRRTSLRDSTSALREIRPLVRSAGSDSGRVYGARQDDHLANALTGLCISELPLHVMVDKAQKRRKTEDIITHLYEKPLPEGSFCRVDNGVYVSSPELTLAQLAADLTLVDVLEIALEFCSGYTLNPESDRGFDDRPCLSSAAKIETYARRLAGRHGAKPLMRIQPYVVDNSASPMESTALMLLCLPSRLGGQQLPLPAHNVDVPIGERAHSHTKRQYLTCDLYWEEFHLDVECDSTKYHSSKEQLGIDSDRRIILDAMGYQYVGITSWQLEHEQEFLNVVQAIRKAMGLRARNVSARVESNRKALREYLTTPRAERRPLRLQGTS